MKKITVKNTEKETLTNFIRTTYAKDVVKVKKFEMINFVMPKLEDWQITWPLWRKS